MSDYTIAKDFSDLKGKTIDCCVNKGDQCIIKTTCNMYLFLNAYDVYINITTTPTLMDLRSANIISKEEYKELKRAMREKIDAQTQCLEIKRMNELMKKYPAEVK